jgi:hypothetical protein
MRSIWRMSRTYLSAVLPPSHDLVIHWFRVEGANCSFGLPRWEGRRDDSKAISGTGTRGCSKEAVCRFREEARQYSLPAQQCFLSLLIHYCRV